MIFITYQSLDYLTYKNDKYNHIKKHFGISEDKNIYWCVKANNIEQAFVNSFAIDANQPFYCVIFETDDYYKIDAIKWNYFVDKLSHDEIKNNEDYYNIENENIAEYIVTDIPDNKIEIPVQFPLILENCANNKNDFYKIFAHNLFPSMKNILNLLPSQNEIEYTVQHITKTTRYCYELAYLRTMQLIFISLFLCDAYYSYLELNNKKIKEQKRQIMITYTDAIQLANRYSDIFTNLDDYEIFKEKNINIRKYIFEHLFSNKKMQYPNEKCYCGSGKKFKKCCMNQNNVWNKLSE